MKNNNMNKGICKWGIVLVLTVLMTINAAAQTCHLQSDYMQQSGIGFYKVEAENPLPYIPMQPSKLMDFQTTITNPSVTSVINDYLNGTGNNYNTGGQNSGVKRFGAATIASYGGGNAATAATSLLSSSLSSGTTSGTSAGSLAKSGTSTFRILNPDEWEEEEGEGGGANEDDEEGDNNWNGSDLPVGEPILPLLLFAGAYALRRFRRKNNHQ